MVPDATGVENETPRRDAEAAVAMEEDAAEQNDLQEQDLDEEDEAEAVEETEENALKLFDSGCRAIKDGDFEAAGDDLCKALEIRVKIHGELSPQCASTYYKYGCSLLLKAQSERDVLPSNQNGVSISEPVEGEATDGDNTQTEDVADNTQVTEDVEEEEESDLELAWKMMDIARVIHEKQHTHTLEEVDVIAGLADISLEKEDFHTCFDDYTKALEILKGIVEPDNRQLAELYFKMALAKQMAKAPAEAIDYCQLAVSVCENRLERLKRELMRNEDEDDSLRTEEIKEMETLSVDLKEKVDELHQMAATPPLLEVLRSENPEFAQTVKMALKAAADAASNGVKAEATPSSSTQVHHLGVVGRGIKRAAPTPIPENGNAKRNLESSEPRSDFSAASGNPTSS